MTKHLPLSLFGHSGIRDSMEAVRHGQTDKCSGCCGSGRACDRRERPRARGAPGQPAGVKCYGINGCAANASCAVKAEDLAALKTLLGVKAYKARFGKSAEHSCKAHGSCGASSHILNWTTTDAGTCQQSHGIIIEESDGKKVAKEL